MNKTQSNWQRLTGQATTAIGNVITNMQVHMQFVRENWNKL